MQVREWHGRVRVCHRNPVHGGFCSPRPHPSAPLMCAVGAPRLINNARFCEYIQTSYSGETMRCSEATLNVRDVVYSGRNSCSHLTLSHPFFLSTTPTPTNPPTRVLLAFGLPSLCISNPSLPCSSSRSSVFILQAPSGASETMQTISDDCASAEKPHWMSTVGSQSTRMENIHTAEEDSDRPGSPLVGQRIIYVTRPLPRINIPPMLIMRVPMKDHEYAPI